MPKELTANIDKISELLSLMEKVCPNGYRGRKYYTLPVIEIVQYYIHNLTYEEYGFFVKEFIYRLNTKLSKKYSLEDRLSIRLCLKDVSINRKKFYSYISKYEEYGMIMRTGRGKYLVNPMFGSSKLTLEDKYQLNFISEAEYIAMLNFKNKVTS